MALTAKRIFREILKSLGIFVLGGIAGVIVLFAFFLKGIFEGVATDVGLGIIALAPVLVILYSIVYFVVGGLSGLVLYWAYRFWKSGKK